MASKRISQAIDRLEGSLARLEQLPVPAGGGLTGASRAEAVAALQSLDALIGDLRKTAHG